MLSNKPGIVHHKAALDGPDTQAGMQVALNSLEGIRACLDARAHTVEIDATALAAEDYLLVHEPALDAETTGHGPVSTCTVEQARSLHIRSQGRTTEQRAPLLSDVVQLFREYGGDTRLQIDYKNVIPFPTDEPLRRLIRLIEPLGERVIVSSIADWQLRKLRALAPWLALGFDIMLYLDCRPKEESADPRAVSPMYPRQLGAYGYWDDHPIATRRIWSTPDYLNDRCNMLLGLVPGVSTFYVRHHLLAQSLEDGFNWVAPLRRAGVQLTAWTLDIGDPVAEANALRLKGAGVEQFTTNTPLALAQLLHT